MQTDLNSDLGEGFGPEKMGCAAAVSDMTAPIFRPVADRSLLVEFGNTIDETIHARVLRLDRALTARPFPGFAEAVPAYATLLIRFDPIATDHAGVQNAVEALLRQPDGHTLATAMREVAICYDHELAPDLPEVAQRAGISEEAVIAAHLAGDYQVFMYGFAPGYAYLAGVPAALQLPRKTAAQRGVAAGSVIIAGPQCLITTLTMPTGWWIIGRSPTRVLTEDPAAPFLFDIGDHLRFHRISRDEYEAAHG